MSSADCSSQERSQLSERASVPRTATARSAYSCRNAPGGPIRVGGFPPRRSFCSIGTFREVLCQESWSNCFSFSLPFLILFSWGSGPLRSLVPTRSRRCAYIFYNIHLQGPLLTSFSLCGWHGSEVLFRSVPFHQTEVDFLVRRFFRPWHYSIPQSRLS